MIVSTELGFDECQDLLRSANVGRLALSTPDGCHIAVLAYSVVEDEVVIAAPSYSVPGTYAEGRMVAFEVDNVGTGAHDGWSVILRGRAEAFVNRREVDQVTRELSPPMGDAGAVNVYLCIPVDDVSGRHWSASAGHAPPYPDSAS